MQTVFSLAIHLLTEDGRRAPLPNIKYVMCTRDIPVEVTSKRFAVVVGPFVSPIADVTYNPSITSGACIFVAAEALPVAASAWPELRDILHTLGWHETTLKELTANYTLPGVADFSERYRALESQMIAAARAAKARDKGRTVDPSQQALLEVLLANQEQLREQLERLADHPHGIAGQPGVGSRWAH
jgi:hypothetical protein